MGKKKTVSHGGVRSGAGRKPGADGPTMSLTVTVPASLVSQLDELADSKGWNRSKAVTEAIRGIVPGKVASSKKPRAR